MIPWYRIIGAMIDMVRFGHRVEQPRAESWVLRRTPRKNMETETNVSTVVGQTTPVSMVCELKNTAFYRKVKHS